MIDRILELEKEVRDLLTERDFIKTTLENRLHMILSETNNLVKQTMIDNFLIDL